MQVGLEFWQYKRKMIQTAKDLLYGDDVVKQIENATTEREMTRILRNARIAGEEKEMKKSWVDRVTIKKPARK